MMNTQLQFLWGLIFVQDITLSRASSWDLAMGEITKKVNCVIVWVNQFRINFALLERKQKYLLFSEASFILLNDSQRTWNDFLLCRGLFLSHTCCGWKKHLVVNSLFLKQRRELQWVGQPWHPVSSPIPLLEISLKHCL